MVLKNQEELDKYWSLEIDLDWMRNLKASWENSLREVAVHYVTKTEQLNQFLLPLEAELGRIWAEEQCQAQE